MPAWQNAMVNKIRVSTLWLLQLMGQADSSQIPQMDVTLTKEIRALDDHIIKDSTLACEVKKVLLVK